MGKGRTVEEERREERDPKRGKEPTRQNKNNKTKRNKKKEKELVQPIHLGRKSQEAIKPHTGIKSPQSY